MIGHSLSPVDHPYFRKVIDANKDSREILWKISWHSDGDQDRIKKFVTMMGINEKNISTGSDVSQLIDLSSGRLYYPGHVFCKALKDGIDIQ